MGPVCGSIVGILVLLAGLSFLAFALGMTNAGFACLIAGITLTLCGLSLILHAFCMCPTCKCAACEKK
jgi:putative effector of murein hydrolase LrgA (UPF0299 family)